MLGETERRSDCWVIRVVQSDDTLGVSISETGAATNIVPKPGWRPTIHFRWRSFDERR